MLNTIYILRNKVNSKVYVGQTWNTLKERWHSGHGYKECTHLNNAIEKHGKEQFCYEILTFCGTQAAADYWEDYFIVKYDSRNKRKGYNLKGGGSRGKDSQEMKDAKSLRMSGESNPMYGYEWTDEQKKRMSENNKGEKNPFFGKTHSNETKAILSAVNAGRKATPETKQKMSASRKGKSPSEEHKKHLSESLKGRVITAEARSKISETLKKKEWVIVEGQRVFIDKLMNVLPKKLIRKRNSKLTWEIVNNIREDWATGQYLCRDIAYMYDIGMMTAHKIIHFWTWKLPKP